MKKNKYFKRFVDSDGGLQESKQNRNFLINEYDNNVVESNARSFFDTHKNIEPSDEAEGGFISSIGSDFANAGRTWTKKLIE
jgi:hypothetical protein